MLIDIVFENSIATYSLLIIFSDIFITRAMRLIIDIHILIPEKWVEENLSPRVVAEKYSIFG